MKTTLVALAAVSAVSAFAQVTITGNMDFAGAKIGGSQLWAMGSTFSQTVGVASTSVINLDALEDIGGGTPRPPHYDLYTPPLSHYALSLSTTPSPTPKNVPNPGAQGLGGATQVVEHPAPRPTLLFKLVTAAQLVMTAL